MRRAVVGLVALTLSLTLSACGETCKGTVLYTQPSKEPGKFELVVRMSDGKLCAVPGTFPKCKDGAQYPSCA